MNESKLVIFFGALLILFFSSIVYGQSGGDFTITQSVIASGGGQQSTGITLTLTGSTGEIFYARSGIFGGYRFEDVPSDQSYALTVSARRFTFTQNPRFIMPLEDLTNVDFIGTGQYLEF